MSNRNNQSGVVSIFIVIFTALLVTIVTVSFVSIMLRNQQQASNADLSASAHDAALAGVEDAKRLLLIYRQCQRDGNTTTPPCPGAISAIEDANRPCNTVKRGLYGTDVNDFSEVLVQRTQSDNTSKSLDQAYTCVTISYLSSDLKGTVEDGKSQLLPLETNGAAFNKIKISWFKRAQGSADALNITSDPANGYDGHTLPQKTNWPTDRPPILRTQLIQMADSFSSTDFDQSDASSVPGSNTNTLFLYPFEIGSSTVGYPFTSDDRSTNTPKSPFQTICSSANYGAGDYACQVTIDLPEPIGGARKNMYVQLGALYNTTDFKIELLNGANPVELVAPVVDSTGRANDLFRRVKAYVNFAGEYPQASIDIDGNLCKNFSVTDNQADYDYDHSCSP